MASYHVFIERAQDPSPKAIARAAMAIGQRYGLPPEAIEQRMSQGRFRVKANTDLQTARAFAGDLERLGVVCTIEDVAGTKLGLGTPPPQLGTTAPPPRPAATRQASSPPPSAAHEPSAHERTVLGRDRAPESSSSAAYQSGLAAAFGDEASRPDTDLGALGGAESQSFALAALDGSDAAQSEDTNASSFDPPPDPSARANLFRPPDEQDAAQNLELAVAPARPAPPPQAALPGPHEASAAIALPTTHAQHTVAAPAPPTSTTPSSPTPTTTSPLTRAAQTLATRPRVRLLAGVMLAILLGFIPATLFASWREGSAYADSRNQLHKAYADAQTIEQWRGLDEMIKGERGVMNSTRQTIAITGILIWAAAGGGVAFVSTLR